MNEECLRIGFSSFLDGLSKPLRSLLLLGSLFKKELSFLFFLVSFFKGIMVADIVFKGGSDFESRIWFTVDEKFFVVSNNSRGGLFVGAKGGSFGRRKSGGREKVGTRTLSFIVS